MEFKMGLKETQKENIIAQYKEYAQDENEKELDIAIREYKKIYNYKKQYQRVLFKENKWIYLLFKKHKVIREYCINTSKTMVKGNKYLKRGVDNKICIREIHDNIRRIFSDRPLTLPLSILNRDCEFKKQYDLAFNLRENVRKCGWCGVEFKDEENYVYCSEECWLKHKEYFRKPEVKAREKEYHKEYNQRPEVKEKKKEYHKEYSQRPEVKEKKKEYAKRPEIKERKRKYEQRPEIKAKRKEKRISQRI